MIGHELGHVKGRDPVILFGVTSVMYIGGLLLWLPLIIYLGFFYFILAFGVIYLVGKFLETRADTESVIVLGPERVGQRPAAASASSTTRATRHGCGSSTGCGSTPTRHLLPREEALQDSGQGGREQAHPPRLDKGLHLGVLRRARGSGLINHRRGET